MRPPRLSLLALSMTLSPLHAAEPTWHRLQWAEAEVVPGEGKVKAALLVPIKVNGVDCTAQLDTGAPGKVIWHRQAPADGPEPAQTVLVETGGVSHAVPGRAANLAGLPAGQCAHVASIGNAFFAHGTLTLDLKRGRYHFAAAPALAGARDAQPLIYAQWPGDGDGGHPLVEVRLPGGRTEYALLDTGSAAFGLSALSAAGWGELTAGAPLAASAAVQTFSVNSWGKQIPCYRTAAAGPIDIARSLSVARPHVSYCDNAAFQPGQKLAGVLGLRHLSERTVTLDYLSRRWSVRAE